MKVIKITKLQGGGFTVEVVVKGQTVRTFECSTLEEAKNIEQGLTSHKGCGTISVSAKVASRGPRGTVGAQGTRAFYVSAKVAS